MCSPPVVVSNLSRTCCYILIRADQHPMINIHPIMMHFVMMNNLLHLHLHDILLLTSILSVAIVNYQNERMSCLVE